MRVLRVRGFALLLAGQAVNATGDWISAIAIWGFASFQYDAGPADLALLFVVLSIPGTLLGPLIGVPIDRFGPQRTLVVANLAGAVNAVVLTQADSYTTIILLALPLGLIKAMADASVDSMPPRMVPDEQLVSANALLGGAQDAAIIIGPLIAAVVNAEWGLTGAFLADAATFLVGAVVACTLRIPDEHHQDRVMADEEEVSSELRTDERPTLRSELRAGLTLARTTAGLRWTLTAVASVYAVWAIFGVLEPLYVRDVLDASDTVFALMQTTFGVGLVLTGLVVAAIGDRIARPWIVAAAIVASGFTAALYLGTEAVAVAYVGVFLWGVDVAFFFAPAKTLLQRYAPFAFHGRILSLNASLESAAGIVATPVAAAALLVLGVRELGIVTGALTVVAGLLLVRTARRIGPVPPPGPVDPSAGSSRDAIALGGPAPG